MVTNIKKKMHLTSSFPNPLITTTSPIFGGLKNNAIAF